MHLTPSPLLRTDAPHALPLPEQHGARLALVELLPGDEALWRQRVEARGRRDAGTDHAHKPGSWADIQAVLARNGGSEGWGSEVDVPLRCALDSTAGSTAEHAAAVLGMLAAAGVHAAAAGC